MGDTCLLLDIISQLFFLLLYRLVHTRYFKDLTSTRPSKHYLFSSICQVKLT